MKIDLTLGTRPARMRPSKMSEDVVLDFSKMPSAGEVLSRYQSHDKPEVFTPRAKANPGTTHPVGGYYPRDLIDDPAPRQEPRWDLANPNLYDRSDSGARFIELHGGTNIHNDPNLSATQRRQMFNGELPHHKPEPGLTAPAELSEDQIIEEMAETVVELMETYPGVTIGEVFNAFFVVQEHPDLSLGQVLEAFRDQFRESHVQLIVEQLKDPKTTIQKAKTKIGTSKNLKSNEPKPDQPKQKFNAVSGSTPGHAIAVASAGVIGKKKKQTDGISGSVNESTTRYLSGRLPGF